MINLAIRGYKDGVLQFTDMVAIDDGAEDMAIAMLADRHAEALKDGPHMIEMEFLDEPDPLQRFVRFGTDPRGMVLPIKVDLP